MTDEELEQLKFAEDEYVKDAECEWIEGPYCYKGLKIWRDHRFENGACIHCGMKLQ